MGELMRTRFVVAAALVVAGGLALYLATRDVNRPAPSAARVNATYVTMAAYQRELARSTGQDRRIVLDRMIMDILFREQAQALHLGGGDGEMSRAELDQLRQRVLDTLVTPAELAVSDGEIEGYFRDHPAQFLVDEAMQVHGIFTSTNAPGDPQARARKALALLTAGTPFAEVASRYSDHPSKANGGDMGALAHGQLPAVVEDAVLQLAAGQTSGVLASPGGFFIIRVDALARQSQRTLASVREQIRAQLSLGRLEQTRRLAEEQLRQRAKIEIYVGS